MSQWDGLVWGVTVVAATDGTPPQAALSLLAGCFGEWKWRMEGWKEHRNSDAMTLLRR